MAEYIEREPLALDILGLTIVDPAVAQYADAVLRFLREAPAADVAPVVHGQWEDVTDIVQDILKERPPYVMLRAYKCSVCGRYEQKKEPYCNCGAKMDGGSNDG